jgi:hypothetical protein
MLSATQNHTPQNPQLLETPQNRSAAQKKIPQNELIARKPGQRQWTPAQRATAALRASQQKPWLHSTGPRTDAGKSRAKINAYKHGLHSELTRKFKRLLREQSRFVREIGRWHRLSALMQKQEFSVPEFTFRLRPFSPRVIPLKNGIHRESL